MICPNCRSDEFCIEKVLDLGGDAWSDEIRFQLLRCRHCGLRADQDSRRGSTDSDCFEHYAYRLRLAEWAELERTVSMWHLPCGMFRRESDLGFRLPPPQAAGFFT
jgi:hypothetical protein